MTFSDKTFLNIISRSFGTIMLLASSVVMVRYLSRSDYGTFLQFMLIVNTAVMLCFVGLPQSIYYFFHHVRRQDTFIIQICIISIIVGCAGALIVYSLREPLALWLENDIIAENAWILATLVLFNSFGLFKTPILLSNQAIYLDSITNICFSATQYAPLFIGMIFFSLSLIELLQLMVVSSAINFIMYLFIFWLTIKQCKEKSSINIYNSNKNLPEKVTYSELFKYAFPIGLSSYFGVLGKELDKYIISFNFTAADFAMYSRGAMEIPLVSTLRYNLHDILMPQYVQAFKDNDYDAFLEKWHLAIDKVAKINFAMFAFFFAISPSIIEILYTQQYIDAVPIFRVYLLLLITGITVYVVIPQISGKTKIIMYATIGTIGINLICSIILIRYWGPIGAASATILATIANISIFIVSSAKIIKKSISEIFPWLALSQRLVIALAISIPIFIFENYNPGGMLGLGYIAGEFIVYLIVYILCMLKFDILTDDDISFLRKWTRVDLHKIAVKLG